MVSRREKGEMLTIAYKLRLSLFSIQNMHLNQSSSITIVTYSSKLTNIITFLSLCFPWKLKYNIVVAIVDMSDHHHAMCTERGLGNKSHEERIKHLINLIETLTSILNICQLQYSQ